MENVQRITKPSVTVPAVVNNSVHKYTESIPPTADQSSNP